MTNLRTFFFQNQRLYLVLTFVVVAFISACGGGSSVMDSASPEQKLSDQTIIVSVVKKDNYVNVYKIGEETTPVLELVRGVVYTFDQSNISNTNHPIAFRDAQDAGYITGVVSSGTPGQSGAKTVFTVPLDAPESLRYYCTFHGNSMGNTIKIIG